MLRRTRRDPILTAAMLLFALGMVALATTFGLFASGHRDLPLWLSLSIVVLPIGLAVGLVRSQRQTPRRQNGPDDRPDRDEDGGEDDSG